MMTMLKAGAGLKAAAGLATLTLVLASCGVSSNTPDNSLNINLPTVKTEFFDASKGRYVVCANLSTGSVGNQVRVSVNANGALDSLRIKLVGQTSTRYGSDYDQSFSEAGLNNTDGRYSGVFDQPAVTNGDNQILPQAIIVKPVLRNVKQVSTSEADRVANGSGGFYATVIGYSTTGQMTNTLLTVAVPSYAFCTFQIDTGEPI